MLSRSSHPAVDEDAQGQALERLPHGADELDRAVVGHEFASGAGEHSVVSFSEVAGPHLDQTEPEVLFRLAPKLPSDVLRVAESGLSSGEELRRLSDAGYQAFLIGESLMRAERPGKALQRIFEEFGATGYEGKFGDRAIVRSGD